MTIHIPTMSNCVDPSAPIKFCVMCNKPIHTCEREVPVDNDYRCPEHPDGVELHSGLWVCSEVCARTQGQDRGYPPFRGDLHGKPAAG